MTAATTMTNACDSCRHLRRFRPISQLLARDLGTDDQPLVAELLKIMQEERQQRDAEAELKAKLFENRDMNWPYRPHVSDYCGLKESHGQFLVHELKNRGGSCRSWEPGESASRECTTCVHQQVGGGQARDEQAVRQLGQLQQNAAAQGRTAPDQIGNYIQLVGTRKAFEAAQAYYAGRITGAPPEYLSSCRRYSTPGNVIPCVTHNPNGTCPGWTSRNPAPPPVVKPAANASQPSMMDAIKKLPAPAKR